VGVGAGVVVGVGIIKGSHAFRAATVTVILRSLFHMYRFLLYIIRSLLYVYVQLFAGVFCIYTWVSFAYK